MSTLQRSATLQALFSVAKTALLEEDQEAALAQAARLGCTRSRDELVRRHVKLVLRIAKEHRRFGVDFEELVSEGLVGLAIAAQRFDPAQGTRFATYAAFWIRGYIRKFTLDNRRMVRMPSTRAGRKIVAHLQSTERRLAQQTGSAPNIDEVAAALDVSVSDVAEVGARIRDRDVAIDAGDLTPVATTPDPETLCADSELYDLRRSAVMRALESLSDREHQVMTQRMLEEEPVTLAAIGQRMGVSRERVRQIEKGALTKIRAAVTLDQVA